MPTFQFPKKQNGFTIIELLLVISIVSILAVTTSTFYSRFLTQNSVSNVSEQLVGSLRKAQMYSMEGKQNSGWAVNYSSNTITLFVGSIFAGHSTAFDEKYTVNSNTTITGLTTLSFSRMTGLPSSTAPITISGMGNTKTITINAQGIVSK